MVTSKGFWQKRKVLITGHTGFKGSWLSLWLQTLGADVLGYSFAPPTTPSLFEIANVEEGITHVEGDIRDKKHLSDVFIKYKPEIVFHLAAQSLVRYSYENPIETYETNVMGSLNVLGAIRGVDSVRSAIMVTTDKCYENKEWEWGYRETDPMGGHDPYSSSKGCMELLVASYRNSFFPPSELQYHNTGIATVRAGNVIGGGDWASNRLIPDIMNAIMTEKELYIRSPNAVRPWQHVLEPLAAYMELAEKLHGGNDPKFCSAWNFGPAREGCKPVEWILNEINSLSGERLNWKTDKSQQPHEANLLMLDCSKALTHLEWTPSWSLLEALRETVAWYDAFTQNSNMRDTSISQILKYTKIRQFN